MLHDLFLLLFYILNSVEGGLRYVDVRVNHEEGFQVNSTFSTQKETVCGLQCTFKRDHCYAYEYDEETKICLMGKLHPLDLNCNGNPGKSVDSVGFV